MTRGLAFILVFSCALTLGAPLHFLSRPFQKLEPSELLQLQTSDATDRALVDFFLYEAYQLRENIHDASAALDRVEEFCKKGVEGGRAHLLCALAISESYRPHSPIQHYFALKSLKDHLTSYFQAPLKGDEKLYAEARLWMTLPAEAGRDLKKALVNLQFLLRQAPDAVVAQHFIARAQLMQGNRELAIENFNIAYHQKLEDGRTRFFYDGKSLIHERTVADGISFGFQPALVVGPAVGFGLTASIWDDRIADTERGYEITGAAATRSVFEIGGKYWDRELIRPFQLALGIRSLWRTEDFFGYGAQTAVSSNSPIRTQNWNSFLRVAYPVFSDAVIYIGWNLGSTSVTSGAVTPAIPSAFVSQPFYGFEWDSRDSVFDPWRGFRVQYQYGYARRSLGSDTDFERGYLGGDAVFSLGTRKALWIKSDFEYVSGLVPYGAIPKWGGVRGAPGTRRSRFQENIVWQNTVEPRFGVGGPFVVGAFGNFGTVLPRFGASSEWQAGGGALFEINTSRYRSQRLRTEVGYFGGELIIQVFAAASL